MVKVKTTRIKYSGTFDFEKLYKTAYRWLKDEHYFLIEDKYKFKPPAEVEMKFHGMKKISGFIMYLVHVRFGFHEYVPVEVVKDGKKKEMVKGRIFIDTWLEVVTDYEGLWSDAPFKDKMRIFLEKFVLKERIDTVHVDGLYYRVLELNEKLKAVLDMGTHKEISHKRPESYDEEKENYGE